MGAAALEKFGVVRRKESHVSQVLLLSTEKKYKEDVGCTVETLDIFRAGSGGLWNADVIWENSNVIFNYSEICMF